MTWPATRLTTYVAGISQVKADDLNAIQDAIAAAHAYTPLNSPGAIAAPGGLVAAANQHVEVSGAGLFKHGPVSTFLPGIDFRGGFFSDETSGAPAQLGYQYAPVSGGGFYQRGIALPVAARILSLALKLTTDATTGTRTFRFKRTDLATNAVTTIASGTTASASGERTVSLAAINHVLLADTLYWIELEEPPGARDAIKGCLQVHDQP